jgi:hypothetical protein
MKPLKLIAFVFAFAFLAGCADVAPIQECLTETPYGFWSGIWHGIIVPFSFIGSLFNDSIAIYAVNNNGALYDLGFVLGTGSIFFWIR